MNENLEPLPASEKKILELAATKFEPPLGAEQRVFESLQASIGVAVATTAVTSAAVGTKAVMSIAGVMLLAGVGAGVMLGRTVLAPKPLPPQVIERLVRVEVPVPSVTVPPPPPVETPQPKKPTATVRAEPKVEKHAADELLAQERELVDTARSALLHGDATAAIAALQSHARSFPTGRLDEERESLWVQALVMKGAPAEAAAKAAQFHQTFPRSLLGPTVDAALAP